MHQASPPLTVLAGVGAADGGHGGAPGHDQLVGVALVVGGLGLGEDQVVHVEPGITREVRRDTGLYGFWVQVFGEIEERTGQGQRRENKSNSEVLKLKKSYFKIQKQKK